MVKITGWGNLDACSANGAALVSRSVGAANASEAAPTVRDVCLQPSVTHYSSEFEETPCAPCPAVSKIQTYSTSNCSGKALLTRTFQGELTEQTLADSCGGSGATYYTAAKGAFGGTQAACTKCPTLTAVYAYSNKSPAAGDAVCNTKKVVDVKYYHGELTADDPRLSADVVCDAVESRSYGAKVLPNGNAKSATDLIPCTRCPALSIVTTYPFDNSCDTWVDPERQEKTAKMAELMNKGVAPMTREELVDLQSIKVNLETFADKFKNDENSLKRDACFKEEMSRWEDGKAKAGLTNEEAKELVKLALDFADDPPEWVSFTSAPFDYGDEAARTAAIKAACSATYTTFSRWDGSKSLLSNAKYETVPHKSYSLSNLTWLGVAPGTAVPSGCTPCPKSQQLDGAMQEAAAELEEAEFEGDLEEADFALDLQLASCTPDAELVEDFTL
eukprot:tig00000459_g1130.t1